MGVKGGRQDKRSAVEAGTANVIIALLKPVWSEHILPWVSCKSPINTISAPA